MTTVFTDEGRAYAATIIAVQPNVVTQVKTSEKEGYSAVQIGAIEGKEKNVNKAQIGHAKGKMLKRFRELNLKGGVADVEVGATIDVSIFTVGDKVTVTATSKGKGFQGVVKRHGFSGVGGQTHGQHDRARHPGSIGASSFPSRVFKGMRMGGRMGSDRVKIQNLRVMRVIPEHNLLVVAGSVAGAKNSYIIIEK